MFCCFSENLISLNQNISSKNSTSNVASNLSEVEMSVMSNEDFEYSSALSSSTPYNGNI